MNVIVRIIRSKPSFFFFISLWYLIAVSIIKWFRHPMWEMVWFLMGGLLGTYILDIAEYYSALSPSPFRSMLFMVVFIVVSFFVVTSSTSVIASGLVLSMYVQLLMQRPRKRSEFMTFVGILLLETYFFIR